MVFGLTVISYIKNAKDEIYGGASTSWMLLDYKTHRPQKPDLVNHVLPLVNNKMALNRIAGKIEEEESPVLVEKRKARASEIDLNGHVTNSKYIEWISDALGIDKKIESLSQLHMNFVSETKCGEEVNILISTLPDSYFIKCVKSTNAKTVFTAKAEI